MGAGYFQSTAAPALLYLRDEDNASFPFAGEFKRLAPHWEVNRVNSRLAAMKALSDAPAPQAFVIDLATGHDNGPELIEWIKFQSQLRFLPIIVLGDAGAPALRQPCVNAGATSYLDQPKSLKEMRHTIRYVVKLCEGTRHHAPEWKEMACV